MLSLETREVFWQLHSFTSWNNRNNRSSPSRSPSLFRHLRIPRIETTSCISIYHISDICFRLGIQIMHNINYIVLLLMLKDVDLLFSHCGLIHVPSTSNDAIPNINKLLSRLINYNNIHHWLVPKQIVKESGLWLVSNLDTTKRIRLREYL